VQVAVFHVGELQDEGGNWRAGDTRLFGQRARGADGGLSGGWAEHADERAERATRPWLGTGWLGLGAHRRDAGAERRARDAAARRLGADPHGENNGTAREGRRRSLWSEGGGQT
jgi:hypothetical protein